MSAVASLCQRTTLTASTASNMDAERRYLLTNVIDNYLSLSDEEDVRFHQELNSGDRKEVKKMVLTLQEAIAEERRARMV